MRDSAIIAPVCSNSILDNWGSIEPHLTRVLAKHDSGHTASDVVRKLLSTEMQLWNVAGWQAIAITQIAVLPQHKTLVVVYTVGQGVDRWLDEFVATLKNFAKGTGCKYLEFQGRPGWARKLKAYSETKQVIMGCRVDG